jgi:hypothetical protein
MKIVEVSVDSVRPSDWRATHMLKPDLKLLVKSMHEYGWISPIIVRKSDSRIIDGFHRWMIAQEDSEFRKKHGKKVPVVFVDCDKIDAMVMHIRLNRTRGQLVARFLSQLVSNILVSKKYDQTEMRQMLHMTQEEINVLIDGSLLKHKKIKEHEYSKAWIPVEMPAGTPAPAAIIETPPNADR